jgi:hypothetical protein
MKIYFEDGLLRNSIDNPSIETYTVISAIHGVSLNINDLEELKQKNDDSIVIYTNSICAFSNRYAWNPELQAPEIYIRAGEDMVFTRIDELTERELREGHNLAKMYVAGEFGN